MPQTLKKKFISIQIKLAQERKSNHTNKNELQFSGDTDCLMLNKECLAITTTVGGSNPHLNILENSVLQTYLLRRKDGAVLTNKEFGKRLLKTLVNKICMKNSQSVDISPPDPVFKVVYLGNVITGWAKGRFPKFRPFKRFCLCDKMAMWTT